MIDTEFWTVPSNMLKDVKKVSDIKKSEDYLRSYWNIGIHSKESKSVIKDKILKKEEQCNITLYENYKEIRFIPKTNFAYTIF